jgi:hypothetical protein
VTECKREILYSHSFTNIPVLQDPTPCSRYMRNSPFTLMMETAGFSEKCVHTYRIIQSNITEYSNLIMLHCLLTVMLPLVCETSASIEHREGFCTWVYNQVYINALHFPFEGQGKHFRTFGYSLNYRGCVLEQLNV